MENRDDILTNTEGEDTGVESFSEWPFKDVTDGFTRSFKVAPIMWMMSLEGVELSFNEHYLCRSGGVFKRYKGLICKESSKDKES